MKTIIVFLHSEAERFEAQDDCATAETFPEASVKLADALRVQIIDALSEFIITSDPRSHEDDRETFDEFLVRINEAVHIEAIGDVMSELYDWLEDECYGSDWDRLTIVAYYIDGQPTSDPKELTR